MDWFRVSTMADVEPALEGANPIKGVKILKRFAARGNSDAQNRLGFIYEYGHENSFTQDNNKRKIEPDFEQAAIWYQRAADEGDLRGLDNLWQVYLLKGNVDEEKALTHLVAAAKAGVMNAQRFLGICYMDGSILPVPKNYPEGLEWLRMAARSGCDDSQMRLAKAYRDGTGVSVDLVKTYAWFSMAAREQFARERETIDRNNKWNDENPRWAFSFIKYRRQEAQIERDKIADQLSQAELIKAQDLFDQWCRLAPLSSHPVNRAKSP